MSPPFLILQTGTPVAPMRRRGGFPHWIRVAAGADAKGDIKQPVSNTRYSYVQDFIVIEVLCRHAAGAG